MIVRTAGVDLITASETGGRFELRGERRSFTLSSAETLATKIDRSLRSAFDAGYDSVVLLAGDIAGLRTEVLEDAFASLASGGAVLGPSADGGFYLAGFHGHVPVDWPALPLHTPSALASLQSMLTALHVSWKVAPRLNDIDSRVDAEAAAQRLRVTPLGSLLLTLLTQPSTHPTPLHTHGALAVSGVSARAPPAR